MRLSQAVCGVTIAALALLVLAGPAYRLGLPLGSAFSIVQWPEVGAPAGGGASAAALWWSRRKARRGAAVVAGLGVLFGVLTAAAGYAWLRQARGAPPLHDVTTDLENPP